ncbi:MAG TPA: SpoIIE family protein phosphatase [Candidatus Competibacter sp.]|nr:SpoIIE family protein phosphatase [Candidatus Competibacter sp.]
MHNHISDLAVNSVDASEQTLSDLDDGSLEVAVRSLRSPTNRGRRDNQDNYLVVDGQGCARFLRNEQEMRSQLPDWPPGHRRLAVLDGMGGHSHGREAAERTIEGLLELPATADLDQLSSALDALHGRLYREFQAAGLETGCTLIVLEIPVIGSALLFHVGDSRVYAVDEQQVQCLTVDHVPATHLALLGLVDSAQWLQQVHSRPNSQISQAFVLGSTLGIPSLYVESIAAELFVLHDGNLPLFLRGLSDRRPLTLESGWVYLLASDGLWHLSNPQAFIRRWPALLAWPHRSLEELLDALLADLADSIRQQQSQPDDNCTVILLRKTGPAGPSPN